MGRHPPVSSLWHPSGLPLPRTSPQGQDRNGTSPSSSPNERRICGQSERGKKGKPMERQSHDENDVIVDPRKVTTASGTSIINHGLPRRSTREESPHARTRVPGRSRTENGTWEWTMRPYTHVMLAFGYILDKVACKGTLNKQLWYRHQTGRLWNYGS